MPFQKGHGRLRSKESYILAAPKITKALKKRAEKLGYWISPETREKIKISLLGNIPWNKGIKVDRNRHPIMGHFQKHSEETKRHLKENHPHLQNEQIGTWKGEAAGYQAVHDWVKVRLGKAKVCSQCDSVKRVQWANKSRQYNRELSDWVELCQKCHARYDSGENWGRGVERFGKYYG